MRKDTMQYWAGLLRPLFDNGTKEMTVRELHLIGKKDASNIHRMLVLAKVSKRDVFGNIFYDVGELLKWLEARI